MAPPALTLDEIGDWLRAIGLGHYECLFRENEIDGEVLLEVTELDLEKFGIPFGHRKRLIKAIAALVSRSVTEAGKRSTLAVDAAERRQLTVMFCDIVGSTAMSTQLDPEDMRTIISAYHRCCTGLIEVNGGFVAKYMGDGVLAYFGYPVAHEHDAELSVRAGLAIADAVPKLETPGSVLHVRIGIATGIVVVGDLVGSGESQERSVVGDTPNLAARLQSIASPDTVVIAEGTRKLLGDLFEVSDLGPQNLKGIAGLIPAWKVLPRGIRENRFEALHQGNLTELVGRRSELDVMFESWTKARAGDGQVVLLMGEAGIGKSRMTAAFVDRLAKEKLVLKRFFCSPQRADSVLSPFIGHMERAAGFRRDDDVSAKLEKLHAKLAMTGTTLEDAALIAAFLSLENDGRYPEIDMPPGLQRQKTMDALTWQVEAASRQAPVLMVFEDIHWADASSLELIGQLIRRISPLRTLLLLTFRSEFKSLWRESSNVKLIMLHRLGDAEVGRLIDHVAQGSLLAAHVRQDIIERTDGIPLFIEEMTKAVLEAGDDSSVARAIASLPSPVLAVPASLHASLMSRLDRLGNAKAIVQIGAAIGREVPMAILSLVTHLSKAELQVALDRLVQAGLMSVQGAPPDTVYTFRHALLQDAAYGTLLREPRHSLHARIAEVIESELPDVAENQPELLARHFAEAGKQQKAAGLWLKAGERAMAKSAYVEAEAHFHRALSVVSGLPDSALKRSERLKAQLGLANAFMYTKSYTSEDTRAAFDQARMFVEEIKAAGERLEDPFVTFSVLFGFWMANYVAFDGQAARELAGQSLTLAEKQADEVPRVLSYSLLGAALVVSGDFSNGLARLNDAAEIYDAEKQSESLIDHFGMDFGTGFLAFRANAHWILGRPDAARLDVERSLANARRIGHIPTLMAVLHRTSSIQLRLGNQLDAKAQAEELVSLAEKTGAAAFAAHGLADQACELACRGMAEAAIILFDRAIAADKALASTVEVPTLLIMKARSHGHIREFEIARECLREAAALINATGERWWEAEMHRVTGEIEWMSSKANASAALSHFENALRIARAQKARAFELRAATNLAELYLDLGSFAHAYSVLGPIYAGFNPTLEVPDLIAAKALLAREEMLPN